jgi:hypothetical protein
MEPEASQEQARQAQCPQCPECLPRFGDDRRGDQNERQIDRMRTQRLATVDGHDQSTQNRQSEPNPYEPVEPLAGERPERIVRIGQSFKKHAWQHKHREHG